VSSKKHILLTGGSGLLGKNLLPLLVSHNNTIVYTPTSSMLDVRDMASIRRFCERHKFDMVIHAGAYTDVPGAESDKGMKECMNTNVLGTKNIGDYCEEKSIPMVYISSDYVYEGSRGKYSAEEGVKPFCFYGWSKLAGELFVPDDGLIIRTSFKKRNTWGENSYTKVPDPVYTSSDFVDRIAPKIVRAIQDPTLWRKRVLNIGTERKLLKDLAKEDYPDVSSIHPDDMLLSYKYPKDSSLILSI
jgi:dTDP-4-dehydrorhamnose reductase